VEGPVGEKVCEDEDDGMEIAAVGVTEVYDECICVCDATKNIADCDSNFPFFQ